MWKELETEKRRFDDFHVNPWPAIGISLMFVSGLFAGAAIAALYHLFW